MELAEAREYVRELEQAINGLVDAIERKPSSALLTRLSERERERDETLARTAKLEAKSQGYANIQLDTKTLDALITELRNGLRADQATVSETLRRVVVGVEVTKEEGTLDVCVPSAVLSVGTPVPTRTPSHSIEGHRRLHEFLGYASPVRTHNQTAVDIGK